MNHWIIRLLMLMAPLPAVCACASGYAYSGTFTPTASTSGTLSDFTEVVTFSGTQFKTLGNGGAVQHTVTHVGLTVPADLTLDGVSSWGWETYSATAGTGIIWWKASSLTTTPPAITYCLGNTAVSTYQGGSQGAEFDASTVVAYHFPDGTDLNVKDFSSNALDLTPHSSPVAGTGKIDGAAFFNGTNNGESIAFSWSAASDITVSWWQNVANTGLQSTAFGFNSYGSGASPRVQSHNPFSDGNLYWDYGNATGGSGRISTSYAGLYSVWTYITLVAKGDSTFQAIYFNGTLAASQNASSPPGSGSDLTVGSWSGGQFTTGNMDEFKIAKSPRTANWIATEYANQSSPPVFGSPSPLIPLVVGQSTITGTFRLPDGSNFNGTLSVQLLEPTVTNTCSGGQVLVFRRETIRIVNGTLASVILYSTRCLTQGTSFAPRAVLTQRAGRNATQNLTSTAYSITGGIGSLMGIVANYLPGLAGTHNMCIFAASNTPAINLRARFPFNGRSVGITSPLALVNGTTYSWTHVCGQPYAVSVTDTMNKQIYTANWIVPSGSTTFDVSAADVSESVK